MKTSFRPVFGSSQVQLRSTTKAVTPFGGLVSFIEFMNRLGLAAKLHDLMPFTLSSPNAIPPAQTLMAFLCSVIVGVSRFAHTEWLRSDKALHANPTPGRTPEHAPRIGTPRWPNDYGLQLRTAWGFVR